MTTAPRTFAKVAAKCISDCYRESERSLVFRDSLSTTAVSALTSIITSAQFVEDIVDRSDSMGRLQVCIFVKSTTPDRTTTQRVLWSSVEDIRASLHRNAMNSLEERAPSRVNNNEAIIGNERADVTSAGILSQEENQTDMRPLSVQELLAPENPNQGSNESRFQTSSLILNPSPAAQPFIIPRSVANEVSSIILEGCGYFRHNSNGNLDWPLSYSELYCKHVTFLLQRIFEAEKQLLLKPNMRYESILPDNLVFRAVKIDGLDQSAGKGKRRAPRDNVFHINLSNRSNTQKHVAFAALCVAYGKEYGLNVRFHAAKAVLETFRREGDSEIGCNRYRERGSNIKVSSCDRRTDGSCLQSELASELSATLNYVSMLREAAEISTPVAFGTIDLTADSQSNDAVSRDFVPVRITHLFPQTSGSRTETNQNILNDSNTEANNPQIAVNKTIPWRKRQLQRVTVLYNFKRPIGSAILVSYLGIGPESTQLETERDEDLPVVACYQAFDPSKAAVIFDLKIHPITSNVGIIRYPYADWYKMRPFRYLREFHFKHRAAYAPPKVIASRNVSEFNGILWHRDWLSPIDGMFTTLAQANQKCTPST